MKSRTLERHMRRLLARNERVIDADRRFFSRRPDRSYRVRLASPSEVEMAKTAGVGIGEGRRLFAVVKYISRHVRLRAFFPAPERLAGAAEDVTDLEAAQLYGGIDRKGLADKLARRIDSEGGDD